MPFDNTYQANHLHTPLLEFILELRKGTQLGGADGGEVGGVGEQDSPAVANELMEVNIALGGQCLEVGRCNNSQSISSS